MERFPGEFPSGVTNPDDIPATADPWERVVKLDHARQWLVLKIDDLRRSCRELSASLNGSSPLTPAEAAALRAAPPHRPMADVYADFRRLDEERYLPAPTPPPGASAEALATRAAALAAAVAALRGERGELRRLFLALSDVTMPWEPTEAEIADMIRVMDGPPGPSLLDMVAEFEAGMARDN